jgi:hypothetical protein
VSELTYNLRSLHGKLQISLKTVGRSMSDMGARGKEIIEAFKTLDLPGLHLEEFDDDHVAICRNSDDPTECFVVEAVESEDYGRTPISLSVWTGQRNRLIKRSGSYNAIALVFDESPISAGVGLYEACARSYDERPAVVVKNLRAVADLLKTALDL